tara:strand:- start:4614 stop:5642 length:1029 start_codon:yes stop_codon:yes gene_type:complete
MSDYAKNILSDPRNEKLVYKTNEDYSSTQIELLLPPNLSQPNNEESLSLPEIAKNNSENLFTIDSELKNIKIFRQGKNMFLSVSSSDKLLLWDKIKSFWLKEGFQILNEDITIASIKTNYLENLSEVQLGTIQRVVGRYVPLLVSPETRDSYATRLIKKDDGYDIIITHYGKEFMSDGDTEFRWQNRPRDPEFENEMISRMYIFLGGDEAREAGLIVAENTGVRSKASIYTDEQGLQTLFVPDIYERVYPSIISSLEILGINILDKDQSDGSIEITLTDKESSNSGLFDNLFSNKSSEEMIIKVDMTNQGKSTLVTIENKSFVRITTSASQEVLRGLYVSLR